METTETNLDDFYVMPKELRDVRVSCPMSIEQFMERFNPNPVSIDKEQKQDTV